MTKATADKAAEEPVPEQKPGIGTLNEKPLHAALKLWAAEPGDQFEVPLEGYFIDVVRGDLLQEALLIEIQTGSFSPLKKKLRHLTKNHPVRLIYPIAAEKWLIQPPKLGFGKPTRRKSPKRGDVYLVFKELVSFPDLIQSPNFSLQVVLTREEELRKFEAKTRRRRYQKQWHLEERRLIEVVSSHLFEMVDDFRSLLPAALPEQFTTKDITALSGQPAWLIQKMVYCMRQMGLIQLIGKQGKFLLYEIVDVG
ncbi:MAG: hypothetical protein ACI85U_002016 [Candidatus Promineifilaceae bacterium]|jgi:hypothetical protein